MPTTLKAIVAATVVATLLLMAGDHAASEVRKNKQCELKARAERAMAMCASTPKCVMTLSDIEHLVDIYQACTRP